MWNRWFLMAVVAILTLLLGLLIYIDSRQEVYSGQASSANRSTTGAAQGYTADGIASANRPSGQHPRLSDDDQQRIDYVSSVLDTLHAPRARLPYYGELIHVYERAGYYDRAAAYSADRAAATDESGDWLQAGTLMMQSVRATNDDEQVQQGALKALEYFGQALRLRPDDPDISTDLAVVHMSLLQPERSLQILREVIQAHPEHVRATFNMAVLMHQTGRTEESVAYFERTLALAENGEWAQRVQAYLDDFHHHTHHQ